MRVKLGKQNCIRSVSEKAMLSHEAGTHYILNFTMKYGQYTVMVLGKMLFLSFFGEIHMRQGGDF